MRSRPAHISRDKASTTAGALPPPNKKARHLRASEPWPLTNLTPYQPSARRPRDERLGLVARLDAADGNGHLLNELRHI
jgi:hypothetical protein